MFQKMKNMKRALSMELREHKSSFMVFFILRILVVAILILQIYNRNYENVFMCILTLLLMMMPSFIQVGLKIEFPTTLEIIILLFIFAAEILGEIGSYYTRIPMWDSVLHTMNGFIAAAIGFSLVDILNGNEKFRFKLSPAFMAIVAFCFSMTIGVVWEFFECGMDIFFGLDMQKDMVVQHIASVMLDPAGKNNVVRIDDIKQVLINGKELGVSGYLDIGLLDTMKDLFVNFVGALCFSIIGFFYVKKRGKGGIVGRFIPRLKKKNADFLDIVEKEEAEKERLKQEINNA